MRKDRVIRFFVGAFIVGAFFGLVSGLIFGGGPKAPKAAAQADASSSKTATSEADDAAENKEPMTPELARAIGANEMGEVLVIMYHLIGPEESEWTRTPENFRKDIALLKAEGFYPINVRDLISGNIDIPVGKSPVVLTFDDSSPGQYRILDDGTVDPDCAVGMLQAAVKEGDWAPRASFFCLLDVTPTERILFGQTDRHKQEKLKNLIDWGYEVGSHTVTHLNLKTASTAEAVKQLAQSKHTLENMIGGGYSVTSLAVPFGEYPEDGSILKQGRHEELEYEYTAALSVESAPSPSPFSTKFRPMRIPRYRGSADYIVDAIGRFKANPELRYISDGDPTTISAPASLADALGEVRDDLGRPIIRY